MGANANTMYEYRYSHNSQFEDGFDTVVRTTANTQVSIGTLAPDRRYYFHVRVVSNTLVDSQWPPSRPLTADIALLEDVGLPPAQRCHNARTASTPLITNIVPDATTDNSFTILWDPPAGGDMGMGYQVQYSTEFTDDPISLGNAPTTATADGTGLHTQENLSPGTRYFVRVRAAGDGLGDEEGWSCAVTTVVGHADSTLLAAYTGGAAVPPTGGAALAFRQTVSGLAPATTYEFQLRAVTRRGVEDNWAYTIGTTLTSGMSMLVLTPPAPVARPVGYVNAPDRCTAIQVTTDAMGTPLATNAMGTLVPRKGRLKITIYPSTLNTGDPATHYRIEYREKGESGWRTLRVVEAPAPIPPSMMPPSVSMTVTPPARPMVQHTGLSDGVTYEYQVFSLVTKGNTFEESSWAASCMGTTPGAEVVDVRTQQPAFIAAPECVGAAYERSEDAINLTWSHTSAQGIPASVFRIEVAQGERPGC